MQVETKSHHTIVDVTRCLSLMIMSEMGLSYGKVVSILAVLLSRDGNPNPNQLKQKEHLSAHFSEKSRGRAGSRLGFRQNLTQPMLPGSRNFLVSLPISLNSASFGLTPFGSRILASGCKWLP